MNAMEDNCNGTSSWLVLLEKKKIDGFSLFHFVPTKGIGISFFESRVFHFTKFKIARARIDTRMKHTKIEERFSRFCLFSSQRFVENRARGNTNEGDSTT